MIEVEEEKHWKEKRQRKQMRVSASQIETAELCMRKWWMSRVVRLPDLNTNQDSFLFGEALHAVCERFLGADDQGRGADGLAVDLYPEGWHVLRDKYTGEYTGEIAPNDQAIIKKLIDAAIENGTLRRLPDRRVEEQFHRTLKPTTNGTSVGVMGFIDLSYPDGVEDHKSTKSMRYAKTPRTLRENTQILMYAQEKMFQAEEEGRPVPETFKARHNIFCKDPNDLRVKHVEIELTREEIESKWQEVLGLIEEMSQRREKAEDWFDIPEPADTNKACNAYGGCQFLPICSGRESMKGYAERLDFTQTIAKNVFKPKQAMPLQPTLEGNTMSVSAKLAAAKAAKAAAEIASQGTAPAPVAAPVPVPVQAPTPTPTPTPLAGGVSVAYTGDSPPWANDDCRACEGLGFNSSGRPCKICDLAAKKAGKPQSSAFTILVDAEGFATWTLIGEGEAEAEAEGKSPLPATEKPVKRKQAIEVPVAPAPVIEEPEEPEEDEDEDEDEDEAEAQAEAEAIEDATTTVEVLQAFKDTRAKPGRPPKSFTLLTNCASIRTSGKPKKGSGSYLYFLDEILRDIGAEMALKSRKASFYDLDVWDRRNKLGAMAPMLAEMFGTDIVVAVGVNGSADLKALLDAIRPYCGIEIIPAA